MVNHLALSLLSKNIYKQINNFTFLSKSWIILYTLFCNHIFGTITVQFHLYVSHDTFSVRSIMFGCMSVHNFSSDSKQWTFIIPWLLCQESGRILVWSFWLWVSLEAAVKLLARFTVTWRLHWWEDLFPKQLTHMAVGWSSQFRASCWKITSIFIHVDPYIGLLECLAFPWVINPTENEVNESVFFMTYPWKFHNTISMVQLRSI